MTQRIIHYLLIACMLNSLWVQCVAPVSTYFVGRRGNIWLSPEGCLLFSTSHTFPKLSVLYSHIGVQQHLPVTAVVHGIRSMKGYEVRSFHPSSMQPVLIQHCSCNLWTIYYIYSGTPLFWTIWDQKGVSC